MRAVGGDKMQLDAAPGLGQPPLYELGVMISSVVQEYMDQPLTRIHRLDRHQQHDRAEGIHRHHLQHPGVAGLQIDRAVDVQPIPPAGLRDRDRHRLRRPTAYRRSRRFVLSQIWQYCLTNDVPLPSEIVSSGAGYHLKWHFDRPIGADDAMRLYALNRALAHALRDLGA